MEAILIKLSKNVFYQWNTCPFLFQKVQIGKFREYVNSRGSEMALFVVIMIGVLDTSNKRSWASIKQ